MKFFRLLSTGLLLSSMISLSAMAQDKGQEKPPRFIFSPSFEFLRSTHGNFFNGPSLKVNYNSSSKFKLGMGIEYSSSAVHHDNGFVLYDVRFIPVYANLKYEFSQKSKFTPYAEASLGLTFAKYDEAPDANPTAKTRITEQGFYAYGGFGLKYAVTNRIKPFVGVGLKGFQNSFNDLDVNPHGITFHVGVSF